MRELGSYKNTEEYLMYVEGDKNAVCPILFKDFVYKTSAMNKSYLIKEEDILAASRVKKSNSISMIDALKLRWEICHPEDRKWDIQRCNKPLREFVREIGLELYLDMSRSNRCSHAIK
jgi:hypothetical protein